MTANTLPLLPGYQWRAPGLDDIADVRQLETLCAQSDGRTNLYQAADYEQALTDVDQDTAANALCAVNDTGQLVACGWVMLDSNARREYRAFLSLNVHPDHRRTGVADALLRWLEARARQVFTAVADGRSLTLRLDAYEEAERDTTARQALLTLYQQHGYQYAMAEDEMRRDLSLPISANSLPAGMNWVTWTPEQAGLFFQVYDAAFRTRPGFPGWNEETWRHNFTGYDEFRPDLSVLLMSGDEPTGYAVCSVEGQEGWIVQMGIHPSYRQRGLGGMVLAEVMRRFRVEGLRTAVLQVNVNNPEAASLYRRLGFEPARRFISYRKSAAGD